MYFSIPPYPDCITTLMALADLAETHLDPGSWLTNLFIKIPEDKDTAQICRDLMNEAGIKFYEIRR